MKPSKIVQVIARAKVAEFFEFYHFRWEGQVSKSHVPYVPYVTKYDKAACDLRH